MKTVTKCVLLLSLFALLCLARFDSIHGQDEISHSMKLIRMLFHDGFSHPEDIMTFSPHLYQLSAWGISELFGDANSFTMRLTNLLFWLATLGTAAWLCRKASPSLLLALGISAPAAIASTAIVEIDQAVMPFLTLMMLLAHVRWLDKPNTARSACIVLASCLCLWGRLSTPLSLVPLLLGFTFLQCRSARRTALFAGLLLAGFGAFAVSWWLYGRFTGTHWMGIYEYLTQSFRETTVGSRHSSISRLGNSLQAFILWGMTPYFLMLLAGHVKNAVAIVCKGGRLPADTLYGLAAVWLLAAFTIVGGALFGFPKYQVAAFPLAFIALTLDRRRAGGNCSEHSKTAVWCLALFACIAFAAAWTLIKDPLFVLRSDLRGALLAGISPAMVLVPLAVKWTAAHIVILLAGLWMWRKYRLNIGTLLLAAGIAANAALLIRQSTGGYNCTYMYGDQGETRAVAAFINDNGYNPSKTLVPHEVLDVFNQRELTDRPPFLLTSAEELRQNLERQRPDVVALSALAFPVATLRELRHDANLKDFLLRHYSYREIGQYDVFVAK